MIVIFCYLPPKTSATELLNFAQSGTKSFFPFSKTPAILSVEVLDVRTPHTQEEEHHGLVTFENRTAAEKATQRLNGKCLNGHPIRVKRFTYRRPTNDTKTAPTEERRRGEKRRRSTMKGELLT